MRRFKHTALCVQAIPLLAVALAATLNSGQAIADSVVPTKEPRRLEQTKPEEAKPEQAKPAPPKLAPPKVTAVKVAYIYNFCKYCDWPAKTFDGPKAPIKIGIIDAAQIGAKLAILAQRARTKGRPIAVQRFQPDAVGACHVLYVPESLDAKTRAAIIKSTAGKPVLLVGETLDIARAGGIRFHVTPRATISIELDPKAFRHRNLTPDRSLLQIARTPAEQAERVSNVEEPKPNKPPR
ncbi:MAG: YfiR family protein [Planctomycetales bacterium]